MNFCPFLFLEIVSSMFILMVKVIVWRSGGLAAMSFINIS